MLAQVLRDVCDELNSLADEAELKELTQDTAVEKVAKLRCQLADVSAGLRKGDITI